MNIWCTKTHKTSDWLRVRKKSEKFHPLKMLVMFELISYYRNERKSRKKPWILSEFVKNGNWLFWLYFSCDPLKVRPFFFLFLPFHFFSAVLSTNISKYTRFTWTAFFPFSVHIEWFQSFESTVKTSNREKSIKTNFIKKSHKLKEMNE